MVASPEISRNAQPGKVKAALSAMGNQRGQEQYKGQGSAGFVARAAAAGHALVLHNYAIKIMSGLHNATNEHPAVHAGVGAIEAGVVRLYAVVLLLGWVRVGCARLSSVHS